MPIASRILLAVTRIPYQATVPLYAGLLASQFLPLAGMVRWGVGVGALIFIAFYLAADLLVLRMARDNWPAGEVRWGWPLFMAVKWMLYALAMGAAFSNGAFGHGTAAVVILVFMLSVVVPVLMSATRLIRFAWSRARRG